MKKKNKKKKTTAHTDKKISPKKAKRKTKQSTQKSSRRRYIPATKTGQSPLIIEPPHEYTATKTKGPQVSLRIIFTLLALVFIGGLLYLTLKNDTPTKIPPNSNTTRRPIQSLGLTPAKTHKSFFKQPLFRNQIENQNKITPPQKPLTRTQAGNPNPKNTTLATAVTIPPISPTPVPEARRSEPFKDPIKIKVKAKNEVAVLRVFSDKPRQLVFQTELAANSGNGTLQWDGTNMQGQPVVPGLYYISVTDAHGTTNDEMWVR